MGIHEAVKTFNVTVRTVLLAAVCGVIAYTSYLGYSRYTQHERELATATAQVTRLENELKVKSEQLEKLETSVRLLKTDQRLARLTVLGVDRDENDKALRSRLRFIELSPTGAPISQGKDIEVPGDIVYIDNWIVKFDDKYVERADLQRGTSLCLFRRIFSEQQKPTEGVSLDEVGMRPQAYARGSQMSQFERQIWNEFWQFANDPDKAAAMGIRAANGEAVSVQVREGKSYAIELRASGGLSIRPIEDVITGQGT